MAEFKRGASANAKAARQRPFTKDHVAPGVDAASRRQEYSPGIAAAPTDTEALGDRLSRADAGDAARFVQALQRTSGNASVTALVGRPSLPVAVQRAGALTAAERQKMDNASRLVDQAAKNKTSAANALQTYASQAPDKLSALKTNFDASLSLYAQAQTKVNFKIEQTKAIAAVRNEVLMTIIDSAVGGIVGKIDEHVLAMRTSESELQKALPKLSSFMGELKKGGEEELTKPFEKQVGGASSEAKSAAGLGDVNAPAAGAPPWANELAFYKSYAQLASHGNALLPIANKVGQLAGPIDKLQQAIADAKAAGRALTYPIDKMDYDAAALESGTRELADAAPGVAAIAKSLGTTVELAQASAPKNVDEVEDEIWVEWIAGLSASERGILDEDYLENYLKKRGIWDRLGIDIGMWFSDDDRAMAVASASAQQQVLAARGTEVEVRVANSEPVDKVTLPGISYELPVIMELGSVYGSGDAGIKCVVTGAKTVKKADTNVLKQTDSRYKSYVREYLLQHGYIAAVVRGIAVKWDAATIVADELAAVGK